MAVGDQREGGVRAAARTARGGRSTTEGLALQRRRRGRRPRPLFLLATIFGALLLAVIVASLVPVPYYAITPGNALAVSGLIKVPAKVLPPGRKHPGSVLLTDVELISLRAIDYPYYAWFDHEATVVGSAALTGPATAVQYNQQGVIDMANARQAATVVAMRTLGYPVKASPDGVIVYQAEPGSPAAAALSVDDVITSAGSRPVTTFASLGKLLEGRKPGSAVALGVRSYSGRKTHTIKVVLGEERVLTTGGSKYGVCRPTGSATHLPAYEPHGSPVACLGLIYAPGAGGSETSYRVSGLPFPVDLRAEGIVGPSAGLAFTLGLLEKLDRADLTGGHKVAATGTMSIDGSVGDVGGVAQKTIAVRDAGATVFLVPPQELAVARAHAGPHLEVLAVASLSQAVHDLEHVGGSLVPPAGS